jgi:hypothetical protein
MIHYLKPTNQDTSTEHGNVSSIAQLKATEARGAGVPIWWQSSDQEVLAAASATTLSPEDSKTTSAQSSPTASIENPTSTLPTVSIANPTSTPTSGAPEQPNSATGLSTGAKAGVGVGALIGVAALALAVVWFFLGRKRRLLETEAEQVHEADPAHSEQSVGTNQRLVHEMLQPEVHQTSHELPGPTWEPPNRPVEIGDGNIKS